ncbi:hypothetical protein B296_00037105, partial [Ensete ventricosum]
MVAGSPSSCRRGPRRTNRSTRDEEEKKMNTRNFSCDRGGRGKGEKICKIRGANRRSLYPPVKTKSRVENYNIADGETGLSCEEVKQEQGQHNGILTTDKRQAENPSLYTAAEEGKQENQGARDIFTTRILTPPLLFPHGLLTRSAEDGGEAKPSPS